MHFITRQLSKAISSAHKLASDSLDQYYQRVAHANRHRFHWRIVKKALVYPPTIDGNEDKVEATKNEDNGLIKRLIYVTKHPEEPLFPDEYSLKGEPFGRVYEKMPFKYTVEAGKTYYFCTCGYSNNQPFCDSTHKMLWTTHMVKRFQKYRPIKYVAPKSQDVWFCNCKQSAKRPFCDGTHKSESVQKANSVK